MDPFFLNEDARIVSQLKNGDEKVLIQIYQTSERQVTAFVTRNNGTGDDARDILQEALVVLWERVRSGRYEHTAKISTFVFATAKNMWLRKLAKARRETAEDMTNNLTPSDDASVLDEMIETEEAAGVASALNQLGDPCRKLLLLYYWEELPMDEIAAQMGFANADTVKSKKYQCKKELTKLLKRFQ